MFFSIDEFDARYDFSEQFRAVKPAPVFLSFQPQFKDHCKGCGSRIATLTMVFKLGLEAQKHWRRLNGSELVAKVVVGVKFIDGEEQTEQAA